MPNELAQGILLLSSQRHAHDAKIKHARRQGICIGHVEESFEIDGAATATVAILGIADDGADIQARGVLEREDVVALLRAVDDVAVAVVDAVDAEQRAAATGGEAVLGAAHPTGRVGRVLQRRGVDGDVVAHGRQHGADDPVLQLRLHLLGQVGALRHVVEEHAVVGVQERERAADGARIRDLLRVLVRAEDLRQDVFQPLLRPADHVGELLRQLVLGRGYFLVDGLVGLHDAGDVLGVVLEIGLGLFDDQADLFDEGRRGFDFAPDG